MSINTHFFLYHQNFYLSTQEAQRMMEIEGRIENAYDIGGHLKIPVKTPKVRLVKVHSFSIQDIL